MRPMFTVIIPAKNRPLLLIDSLLSVLGQSFEDYEIIISNNGADPEVREGIADKIVHPKIYYVEQLEVLAMPDHWEKLVQMARGRYVTILPDRSVLKRDALKTIATLHNSGGKDAAIITWPWDLYYDSGFLQTTERSVGNIKINSVKLILESMQINAPYPMSLPRGLNSSVSIEVLKTLLDLNGRIFSPINPDFSFAYDCLLTHPCITHISESLMISQGFKQSNGGNGYITDASAYISTLNISNPIRYSPIKSLFVENIIVEDFYSACHRNNRHEIINNYGRENLYIKCIKELDFKKAAGVLDHQAIADLEHSLDLALASEDLAVLAKLNDHRKQSMRPLADVRRFLKNKLVTHHETLLPIIMRLRGARKFDSVLAASGHKSR